MVTLRTLRRSAAFRGNVDCIVSCLTPSAARLAKRTELAKYETEGVRRTCGIRRKTDRRRRVVAAIMVIDGPFPTICGTGLEDYVGSAWGMGRFGRWRRTARGNSLSLRLPM
jgi:hypothetical protein